MKFLREYIQFILYEKRHSYDKNDIQTEINKLELLVDKNIFFHMTDDFMMRGLNVKTQYKTPIGIYTYPLTHEFLDNLLYRKSWLPFAHDRQYIVLYKPLGRLLTVSQYTWSDFEYDANKLNYSDVSIENIKKKTLRKNIPASSLMYMLYDGDFTKHILANKRLQMLGYIGIYDDVGEVIHFNEPVQAFFVSSKVLEIIDIIQNPIFVNKKNLDKDRKIINNLDVKQQAKYISKDVTILGDITQTKELIDELMKSYNSLMFRFISWFTPEMQEYYLSKF